MRERKKKKGRLKMGGGSRKRERACKGKGRSGRDGVESIQEQRFREKGGRGEVGRRD